MLVYSASAEAVNTLNDVIRSLGGTQVYSAYSMEKSFENADFEKITYDSEVYSLVQDKDVLDDMWLELAAGLVYFLGSEYSGNRFSWQRQRELRAAEKTLRRYLRA